MSAFTGKKNYYFLFKIDHSSLKWKHAQNRILHQKNRLFESFKNLRIFCNICDIFWKFHPNSKVRTFRTNKDKKISKISSERLRCVLNRQINEIYPTLIFWLVTSLNAEIFKKWPKLSQIFIFPRLKLSAACGNAVSFMCDIRV